MGREDDEFSGMVHSAKIESEMRNAHPQNVPGDWYIEDGCCTACAVPETHAPGHFSWATDSSGQKTYHCVVSKQPATVLEVEKFVQVAVFAEFECLRYGGTDPVAKALLIAAGAAVAITPEGSADR